VKAPLLANMTEFGRTPVFTAIRVRSMGYKHGDLARERDARAAKAQEELYAAIKRDGGTHNMLPRMQTRKELFAVLGYLRVREARREVSCAQCRRTSRSRIGAAPNMSLREPRPRYNADT
jgi:2-methylisocitrate lyase-like PEP mutase family enzyme